MGYIQFLPLLIKLRNYSKLILFKMGVFFYQRIVLFGKDRGLFGQLR